MVRYRLNNIKMALDKDENAVFSCAKELLKESYGVGDISDMEIVKKSLDARHKDRLCFVYAVEFECDKTITEDKDLSLIEVKKEIQVSLLSGCFKTRPLVVGTGPSGMMAALCLAELGAKPVIIERGAPVDERKKMVHTFWEKGELSEVSNVQFGEGGAGTFSDGKLMTGIKKDMFTKKVMDTFIEAGAPKEIAYLAKPHIGTDNLLLMTKNIREKIISLGGEYRFYEKLADVKIENGCLKAAVIERVDGSHYDFETDYLFLGLGHSARDTFEMLYGKGIEMAQKPFAVGVRIEHLQKDINLAQYGKHFCSSPYLGAADYKMAVHLKDNRSVYTFCMCPGGVVVGATSLTGHVVTNGMSEFRRDKENANAALLVNVDERDFGSLHPLAGMYFQEKLEKKAFILGGSNYFAPVQLVRDFLNSKPTTKLGRVKPSYLPGVKGADFRELFSEELCEVLSAGIRAMGQKLRGFDDKEAVLTAVESRSSSPVRIVRNDSGECSVRGIYPIGEGAGYAGGITSAAADGVKAVYKVCQSMC